MSFPYNVQPLQQADDEGHQDLAQAPGVGLLAIGLLGSVLAPAAKADAIFSIGTVTAPASGTVDVPVSVTLNNGTSLGSFTLAVDFQTASLTTVSVGSDVATGLFSPGNPSTSPVTFGGLANSPAGCPLRHGGTYLIATMEFSVPSSNVTLSFDQAYSSATNGSGSPITLGSGNFQDGGLQHRSRAIFAAGIGVGLACIGSGTGEILAGPVPQVRRAVARDAGTRRLGLLTENVTLVRSLARGPGIVPVVPLLLKTAPQSSLMLRVSWGVGSP